MNMLKNRVVFGLLTESEKKFFTNISKKLCDRYDDAFEDWFECNDGGYCSSSAYRLRLIKGNWYTYKRFHNQGSRTFQCTEKSITDAYYDHCLSFRPATQDEIDAEIEKQKPNKPEYIDYDITWTRALAQIDIDKHSYIINNKAIGTCILDDYVLAGYLFDGESFQVHNQPVKFNSFRSKIESKATKARLVRVD